MQRVNPSVPTKKLIKEINQYFTKRPDVNYIELYAHQYLHFYNDLINKDDQRIFKEEMPYEFHTERRTIKKKD